MALWAEVRRIGDVPQESPGRVDAGAELLARIARGDRQALADLYAREGTSLLHYLLQFTADHGIAEELLQDTFVAVWKNAGSFAGRSRARAWLFGIARRRACKHLRRREPPLAGLEGLEGLATSESEPEAALFARLDREALLAGSSSFQTSIVRRCCSRLSTSCHTPRSPRFSTFRSAPSRAGSTMPNGRCGRC